MEAKIRNQSEDECKQGYENKEFNSSNQQKAENSPFKRLAKRWYH